MVLKKGEKRIPRYPDEYALLGINTMAAYNVPCSVMPGLMESHCKAWSNADTTGVKFGTAHLFRDFRFSVPFLCMVHIGYLLTKHAKKVMTHQQDGTGTHSGGHTSRTTSRGNICHKRKGHHNQGTPMGADQQERRDIGQRVSEHDAKMPMCLRNFFQVL